MSQVTTHVLDTARGKPAAGITISIAHLQDDGSFHPLGSATTNEDGRVEGLVDPSIVLAAGTYQITFLTGPYLQNQTAIPFYPKVCIECNLEGDGQHYHIPLLLSPFGYSTYRGS